MSQLFDASYQQLQSLARRHLAKERRDHTLFNTDLVALDVALAKLQAEQPEKARVVEMRFFAGMTIEEIAEVMQVTPRTVHRYWAYAQARLYKDMTTGLDPRS